MAPGNRTRTLQILRAAEGYLELEMPQQALDVLARLDEASATRSQALYLRGEALRWLERHGEAIEILRRAAEQAPSNLHVWLALGWCYKRTDRLDLAIDALEQAQATDAEEAILYYNLACYQSLAGNKTEALENLSRAVAIDGQYRDRMGDEPDFDPIRSDPEFQALATIVV